MNFEDCKEEMVVIVNPHSIQHTTKKYSSNPTMEKMKGEKHKIERVDHERKAVRFKGFIWDPLDLRPIDCPDPDPEPIIFHFDESKL